MSYIAERHHSLDKIAEAREVVVFCRDVPVGRLLLAWAGEQLLENLTSMISMVTMKSNQGGI